MRGEVELPLGKSSLPKFSPDYKGLNLPAQQSMEIQMSDTYLTNRQIGERFNVHHLTPRRWVREDPTFPRPVKLSPGCTRWKLSEIEAWEAAKARASAK